MSRNEFVVGGLGGQRLARGTSWRGHKVAGAWIGGLAIAALSLGLLLPVAAQAITLKEAVERTLRSHPEIGAIRNNRRAIDQELRQARGAYLPSIDARGAFGHEFSNNSTTRNRAGRRPGESGWVSMNRYEAGVNLRQLVFDGLGTRREVERQLGRATSAQYRVADTAQAVALRAVEAYLEVARTERIVRIAASNVRIHEKILKRVIARAKGGSGPQSDVDQARARIAAARAALAQGRGRYADAVAAYVSVVGERPKDIVVVAAPETDLPSNVDEAVQIAMEAAPSISAAAADVRAAEAAVGVAKSRFFPRLDIEVSANYLYNVDGTRGPNRDFSAMLVGRWNLYRGGIDRARRREAVARLFESRSLLAKTQREVAQQVSVSWNALNQARERRVSLRQQLESNGKVRVAYSRQFDRGRRTLLDLLDIQNEIFTSETNLITEEFTIRFGAFRTLATMGKLVQTLGLKLPTEAVKGPAKTFLRDVRDDLKPFRVNE